MTNDPFTNMPVIQGTNEFVTTRQRGIDAKQVVVHDPHPLGEPIAGDAETKVTRQDGAGGGGYWLPDGVTFAADHDAPAPGDSYSDRPISGVADRPLPPPLLTADRPISRDTDTGWEAHPGVVPGHPSMITAKPQRQRRGRKAKAAGTIVAADKPLPGEKIEGAPRVFSAAELAAAKAARK